ncbi:MAG: 3,4-dihydroxy-2-butanone-4-phosphate synthase, partial [Myxococcaceae bacterium]
MARRLEEVGSIALVERALSDIRKGKMVVLTDDEERENEGDLVMAAAKVTPAAINFMATHGRGLICLSLTDDRLRQLELPLMVHDNTSPYGTAFTVSIEAAQGVTTGISAADRARTIQVAVAPNAQPGDLVRPGHVFPLRARQGGVLVRTGQTEGSVDLARLAGLPPAGVICEVMNADGSMARRPELLRFTRRHRLTLLSVADLIRYRLQRDRLVRRVGSRLLERAGQGSWQAHAYASDVDAAVHVALVKGDVTGTKPVLTRVHRACPLGDVFGSLACDCGAQLESALASIAAAGRGVLVYLRRDEGPAQALLCTHKAEAEARSAAEDNGRLREFGIGAQILKDLGLRRLRLLTNNPKKIVGLQSYSLEVVEQLPLGRKGPPPRRPVARLSASLGPKP